MYLQYLLSLKLLFVFVVLVKAQYDVPDIRVEALTPRGLRVSIADEEGISLFAFHGKINQEMNGREAGTFSVDINRAKDGRWTYLTKAPKLKIGDVVNYWVNVDFDDGNGKRGYIKDFQSFTVTELVPESGLTTPSTVKPTESTTTTTTTNAPSTPTRSQKPTGAIETRPPCKESPTMVKGKYKCQGELILEENFGNPVEKRWLPEVRFARDPDYEFVVYQKSKENLYVEKNKLHIKPTLVENRLGEGYVFQQAGLDLGDSCTGIPGTLDCVQKPKAWSILPPVFSAQVSSKQHFSFVYGIIEIEARLPQGDWIYPELYLRSKNDDYGPGLDSGLIRIAHSAGNDALSNILQGGCVLGESVSGRNFAQKTISSQKPWNNASHVFRLEWRPDRITISVNKQVYGNIYPPEDGFASEEQQLELKAGVAERWRTGSPLAPFDKEMYIVLGVGVGGLNFPNQDNVQKPWDNFDPKRQLTFYRATQSWNRTWSQSSELIVDSVRVWAL